METFLEKEIYINTIASASINVYSCSLLHATTQKSMQSQKQSFEPKGAK